MVFKRFLVGLSMMMVIWLLGSYVFFSWNARGLVSGDIEGVPFNEVGLLLGTSRLLNNGDTNLFFTTRCEAAFDLWKNGKIDRLVISGDSANPRYDEPKWMRFELLGLGIPDSLMLLDKQGFSTMESLVFCKMVLELDRVTVISQGFHNERAVVLAGRIGLEATGYNAESVWTGYGWKTGLREFGARGYWAF